MRAYEYVYALLITGFLCAFQPPGFSQPDQYWHGIERSVRYQPDGRDFVIANGQKRFNRALYGTHTGFRVEGGDLPEFALYMPGMGGNFKLGIAVAGKSKWLTAADSVVTRYRPGSLMYEIRDSLLGDGKLKLTLLAMDDAEGMLLKITVEGDLKGVRLIWAFGGATGKKFSRDGDIGADPESVFYLKQENCRDNFYAVDSNAFTLYYGAGSLPEALRYRNDYIPKPEDEERTKRSISGLMPPGSFLKTCSASMQDDPVGFYLSENEEAPALGGTTDLQSGSTCYFSLHNPLSKLAFRYEELPGLFEQAERTRSLLAGRIVVNTPDPYINAMGGALAVAADAIWEDPSFLHGAVAWRMRLPGWRGAFAGDWLGWHDRAERHFNAYAQAQYTEPPSGPNDPDTERNLARQREVEGNALFSSGYISRNPGKLNKPHHYDMNLVFVDQLLRHCLWTGDLGFVRDMWPLLMRHLDWEKRCFDADGDGLFDAYCCIWASDGVQYSGGGVAHSSAYNYWAFNMVARLAEMIGEDPAPFQAEADRIFLALNADLWLPEKGWYGEYRDLSGLKKVHDAPAIWTIYHTLDSEVADPFQAYQSLRYIDTEIPHIPVKANGLPGGDYHLLSTSGWMPYTWSVNNVALAENLHASLAYWQGGRPEEAFRLWKSALLESMYLSSSPGGFGQLPFYDAIRGELYRDFADPVGMASRTLVEGLFGVQPDALDSVLTVQPGWPAEWAFASFATPDLAVFYNQSESADYYNIVPQLPAPVRLRLVLKARKCKIDKVIVNGQTAGWTLQRNAVGSPVVVIETGFAPGYEVAVTWSGDEPETPMYRQAVAHGDAVEWTAQKAEFLELFDPQAVLDQPDLRSRKLTAKVKGKPGNPTVFVRMEQGGMQWWAPICLEVKPPVDWEIIERKPGGGLSVRFKNNTAGAISGEWVVNKGASGFAQHLDLKPVAYSSVIHIPESVLEPGANTAQFSGGTGVRPLTLTDWDAQADPDAQWVFPDLTPYFNDRLTNILKNEYRSPRPASPTLQLPLQGIGNWAYPFIQPEIDDSGLKALAGEDNRIGLPQGVPFAVSGQPGQKDVLFVTQWDNFPATAVIPLSGSARHAYFLMAGTTNPMQSRFDNGEIVVTYQDGTGDTLTLRNPETWAPIEQDYYVDGYAFRLEKPRPPRIALKTGLITREFKEYTPIKGFSEFGIDGGAAIVLDLRLDPEKALQSMTLRALANDVVIGLMAVALMK